MRRQYEIEIVYNRYTYCYKNFVTLNITNSLQFRHFATSKEKAMIAIVFLLMLVVVCYAQSGGIDQRYYDAYRCADTDIIEYLDGGNTWYDDDSQWWLAYSVCISPDSNPYTNVFKITTHANGPNEWYKVDRESCDNLGQFSVYDVLQNNNVFSDGWSVKYDNPQVDVSTQLGNMPCNQYAFDVLKIDPSGNLERTCPCYSRVQCNQYTNWMWNGVDVNEKTCAEQLLWQCDPNNCDYA
jgi:hypothetical protein